MASTNSAKLAATVVGRSPSETAAARCSLPRSRSSRRFYEADGHLPGGRVVFLLDEVARLGYMSALGRARDAGRKYGITLVMLYQSEGQLREHWGEGGKSAWFESASWRSYAAINSLEQARAVSEALGDHGWSLRSPRKTAARAQDRWRSGPLRPVLRNRSPNAADGLPQSRRSLPTPVLTSNSSSFRAANRCAAAE